MNLRPTECPHSASITRGGSLRSTAGGRKNTEKKGEDQELLFLAQQFNRGTVIVKKRRVDWKFNSFVAWLGSQKGNAQGKKLNGNSQGGMRKNKEKLRVTTCIRVPVHEFFIDTYKKQSLLYTLKTRKKACTGTSINRHWKGKRPPNSSQSV